MKKMKRAVVVTALCLLLAALCVIQAFADTYYEYDHFTYRKKTSTTIIISDYDNSKPDMVIPDKIIDYTVVGIDNSAFANNNYITSVVIPDTVKQIDAFAFGSAVNLTDVFISGGSLDARIGTFNLCENLTTLTINADMTAIPAQFCYGCSSLGRISLPDTVKSIGNFAFANCTSLEEINIPSSVTEIDSSAFDGADNLTIFCTKDSYARTFAEQEGIPYIMTDYQIGDVDLDNDITIKDATLIQQYLAHLTEFDAQKIYLSDYDNNGRIDISDATGIQKFIAHLI